MTVVYVVLGALVLLIVWGVLTYNGLVAVRNRVDESWSGIDVQLKRRHELVPNLVTTVKAYADHERDTFAAVTNARAAAMAATDGPKRQETESRLTAAIGGIQAVAEQYPQLRATENFQLLQSRLAEIEDQIQAARRIFNSNVQRYNTRREVFPNSLIAGAFPRRELFQLDAPAERAVPVVAF